MPSSSKLPRRLQPRKSPRQSRAQTTVEAVVEAASRVLVERGWSGLTMQEVATVAGVSPGSLYQYFSDKEALVAAIIEQISAREVAFQTARFAAFTAAPSLDDILCEMIRGALAFQRQEGPLMRATLEAMPFVGRHPGLVDRVRQMAAVVRQLFEAHRASISHPDLGVATHVFVNAIMSVTHDGALPRPASLDDETAARELIRLARGYLGVVATSA